MEVETYEEIVPTRIEAKKVTKENMSEVAKWCQGQVWDGYIQIAVARGERVRHCPRGWYVIKNGAGDLSLMSGPLFEKKYRKVEKVVKQVPLVHYQDGKRIVIGTADVEPDGKIVGTITDSLFAKAFLFADKVSGYSLGPGTNPAAEISVSVVMKPEDYRNGGCCTD